MGGMVMTLNKGDIVRFIGWKNTALMYGVEEDMKLWAERMYFGLVKNTSLTGVGADIKPLHSWGRFIGNGVYSWQVSDLEKVVNVSLDQAIAAQKVLEEDYALKEKDKINALLELRDFNSIDYLTLNKEMAVKQTYLYPIIRIEDKVYWEKPLKAAEYCFLFSENTNPKDIIVSIPQDWVNYLGYSEQIINEWLEFIKGLGFPIRLGPLKKGPHADHEPYEWSAWAGSFLQTNQYYEVGIEATEYPALNYLTFLLIRYLYLTEYNNIPGLCLKLKGKVPLTNLQILLLVHSLYPYGSYYGMTANLFLENEVIIPDILSESNMDKLVLKKINKSRVINDSFCYIKVPISYHEEIIKIMKERQWDKIYGWLLGLQDKSIKISQAPPVIKKRRRSNMFTLDPLVDPLAPTNSIIWGEPVPVQVAADGTVMEGSFDDTDEDIP